jgi:hypothetical protein
LDVARRLTELILDAQGTGDLKMARSGSPAVQPLSREFAGGAEGEQAVHPLAGDLVRLFSNCGVMKAAVDGAVRAAR